MVRTTASNDTPMLRAICMKLMPEAMRYISLASSSPTPMDAILWMKSRSSSHTVASSAGPSGRVSPHGSRSKQAGFPTSLFHRREWHEGHLEGDSMELSHTWEHMLHECLAKSLLDHLVLPQFGQRAAGPSPPRTHMNPQAAHTSLSPISTADTPAGAIMPAPLRAIVARDSIPSSYSPFFRPIIPFPSLDDCSNWNPVIRVCGKTWYSR